MKRGSNHDTANVASSCLSTIIGHWSISPDITARVKSNVIILLVYDDRCFYAFKHRSLKQWKFDSTQIFQYRCIVHNVQNRYVYLFCTKLYLTQLGLKYYIYMFLKQVQFSVNNSNNFLLSYTLLTAWGESDLRDPPTQEWTGTRTGSGRKSIYAA